MSGKYPLVRPAQPTWRSDVHRDPKKWDKNKAAAYNKGPGRHDSEYVHHYDHLRSAASRGFRARTRVLQRSVGVSILPEIGFLLSLTGFSKESENFLGSRNFGRQPETP